MKKFSKINENWMDDVEFIEDSLSIFSDDLPSDKKFHVAKYNFGEDGRPTLEFGKSDDTVGNVKIFQMTNPRTVIKNSIVFLITIPNNDLNIRNTKFVFINNSNTPFGGLDYIDTSIVSFKLCERIRLRMKSSNLEMGMCVKNDFIHLLIIVPKYS